MHEHIPSVSVPTRPSAPHTTVRALLTRRAGRRFVYDARQTQTPVVIMLASSSNAAPQLAAAAVAEEGGCLEDGVNRSAHGCSTAPPPLARLGRPPLALACSPLRSAAILSCSSADARSSAAADGSAYTPFPFIDLLPPLFPSWLTPALGRFPSYPLLAAGEIIVKWSSISSCLNCFSLRFLSASFSFSFFLLLRSFRRISLSFLRSSRL